MLRSKVGSDVVDFVVLNGKKSDFWFVIVKPLFVIIVISI